MTHAEAKDGQANAERVTMSAPDVPSPSDALAHLGDVFVNFRNRTFQWVHIKRFQLPAGHADDGSVLSLLIAHDRYGDDYASGECSDNPDRHGPYWRDRVTVAAFGQTEAGVEDACLCTWAEEHAEFDTHLRDELERQVFQPIAQATRIYRLADLGKDAFHDWGGVLGPFHELVLIDRVSGVLSLIVASDD